MAALITLENSYLAREFIGRCTELIIIERDIGAFWDLGLQATFAWITI